MAGFQVYINGRFWVSTEDVGRLPSQTLADDLNKWREWFREHEGALYWDPASSRIRVRGAEDEAPPEGSRGREGLTTR